jgi:type IX secretion system PorP/SprF family membrane protein
MKRLLTPLILLLFVGLPAFAQQIPQYSMYMLNPYALNPACAGLENTLVATGAYRKQWVGLAGAPESQHINAHMPLYVINSGVGMLLENAKIGAHRTTRMKLSYNYQREIGRQSLLSFGLSAGYLQYALDGDKLRAPEGDYEQLPGAFNHNDPNLPTGKVQAGVPYFDAGVHFQGKKLEIGVSSQPIFAPILKISGTGQLSLRPQQHFLGLVAWRMDLNEKLTFKPSVLVKTDFVETQVEISTNFRWNDNIMTGFSFRGFDNKSKDAAILYAGMRLNEKTYLAYSFDIPLSALNVANRGSHEIMMRYSLNKPIGAGKLPPIIHNPRFF